MSGKGLVVLGMESDEVVLPAEDTLLALIDHLVLPLLPLKPSPSDAPTADQQRAVAVQLHAVVLLYNYYIKKRHPALEFLTFDLFCQMAVIVKPSLMIHMTHISQPHQEEGKLNGKLSVTEKAVMEACNICKGLDPSRAEPNTAGWPICKVAVFLVDPPKEKCMVQFSILTQGVWSLIEKDLDAPSHTKELSGNSMLRQVAFSIVKDKAGIDQTSLKILETHRVYSLSREKSTTQFYIMHCTEAKTDNFIDIDYLISCLDGALVTREENLFEATSVVDNFHLLPYSSIISTWFGRRNDPVDPECLLGEELEMSWDEVSPCNEVKQADCKPGMTNPAKMYTANCKKKVDCVYDLEKLDVTSPASKQQVGDDGLTRSCSKDLLLNEKEAKNMLSSTNIESTTPTSSKFIVDSRDENHEMVAEYPFAKYTSRKFLEMNNGQPHSIQPSLQGHGQPNMPVFKQSNVQVLQKPSFQELENPTQNLSIITSQKLIKCGANERFEQLKEVIDSKSNDFLQTVLQVLREQQDILRQEQQHLEEIVGEVEKILLTNSYGESEALLKVKLIYEAVRVAYGKGLSDSCTDPDERCLSLGVKRKRDI